jgi:hypothetical protein
MSDNLSKYILTTIAYYDVMDYPMTVFEIWKYLTKISSGDSNNERFSLKDVMVELENEKLQKFMEEFQGFYFLRGRKSIVLQRIERNKISVRKIKIVKRVVFWLRFVPFVRSVAIAGRLAMKNAEGKSDLDLFIILKKNRIFTGRLLVTLVVHLLGKRRYGNRISDRICLNHFITTKYAVLGKDLFAAHEYAFLLPIFGAKTFSKFQKKNNWINKYKPNFEFSIRSSYVIADSKITKFVRKNLEKILQFDVIEETLSQWQEKRIVNNPKSKQQGGIILCGHEELAFWPNFENQGPKVFEKFQERISHLK